MIPVARSYDLPVKLFHYAMLGVPIVAPDTRSIRELDSGQGLLYLFGEGEAGDAIERALVDPERSARAESLQRLVTERHTWTAVVTSVLDVCRAATRTPRRSRG